MKNLLCLAGFFLKLITFSIGENIYCDQVLGQDLNALPCGFTYSNFINIKKLDSLSNFLTLLKSDQNIQQKSQYFNYTFNENNIKNFKKYNKCKWHLHISIELPESLKNKQYKLCYRIVIQDLNKKENQVLHITDFLTKEIYQPNLTESSTILFTDLTIPLPLKKIQRFLKVESEENINKNDASTHQLILIPYLITSSSHHTGKIYTQCLSQYTIDEEENPMPYLSFE